MIVQYYKPNSKNTGCAFSFDIGSNQKNNEPCIYIRAIKQFSWNNERRTGSFSENAKNPEKSISLKINEIEAGGFINAIENYCDFSAFHSFQDNKTSISFKPYTKKDGGIGVEMSEAYGLLEFLKVFLQELYLYRLQKTKEYKASQQ